MVSEVERTFELGTTKTCLIMDDKVDCRNLIKSNLWAVIFDVDLH